MKKRKRKGKEKEKKQKQQRERKDEKKKEKKNNDCTLTFYVDIFGDGVFDSLRGDLYFGRNGFHFSDLKPDDQICCNFTANSSVYYIVSPLLFRGGPGTEHGLPVQQPTTFEIYPF